MPYGQVALRERWISAPKPKRRRKEWDGVSCFICQEPGRFAATIQGKRLLFCKTHHLWRIRMAELTAPVE